MNINEIESLLNTEILLAKFLNKLQNAFLSAKRKRKQGLEVLSSYSCLFLVVFRDRDAPLTCVDTHY